MKKYLTKRNGCKRKWKKKQLARAISFVLVVALFVQTLPMQSYAASEQKIGRGQTNQADTRGDEGKDDRKESSEMPLSILGEVDELREEKVKHFRMSDGTYTAVSYGMSVHYRDEAGKWRDIDNSLMTGDDSDTYYVKDSNHSLHFYKSLN